MIVFDKEGSRGLLFEVKGVRMVSNAQTHEANLYAILSIGYEMAGK